VADTVCIHSHPPGSPCPKCVELARVLEHDLRSRGFPCTRWEEPALGTIVDDDYAPCIHGERWPCRKCEALAAARTRQLLGPTSDRRPAGVPEDGSPGPRAPKGTGARSAPVPPEATPRRGIKQAGGHALRPAPRSRPRGPGARRLATLAQVSALVVHHLEIACNLVGELRDAERWSCTRLERETGRAKLEDQLGWHRTRGALCQQMGSRVAACALDDWYELRACIAYAASVESTSAARRVEVMAGIRKDGLTWERERFGWALIRQALEAELAAERGARVR